MSYGIRIRHHTARSGLFPVPLPHKPLLDQTQPVCGFCQRATGQNIRHLAKTVHLVLDAEGCAIVAREIWDDFCKVTNRAGFVPANVVVDPPTQFATPATAKLRLDGIEFGSIKTGTFNDVEGPDVMDLDGYVDKCARLGIGQERALNMLLAAAISRKDR